MEQLIASLQCCQQIKTLRIEDSHIVKDAFRLFVDYIKESAIIDSLGLVNIQNDSTNQFKDLFEVI